MTNYVDKKEVYRNKNSHQTSNSKPSKGNSKKRCTLFVIKVKNQEVERLGLEEISADFQQIKPIQELSSQEPTNDSIVTGKDKKQEHRQRASEEQVLKSIVSKKLWSYLDSIEQ